MELNVRLLLILTSVITLVLGGGLLIFAQRRPRSAVLRTCGVGFLVLFLAFAGMAARNVAPAIVSTLLANTLVVVSLVIMYSATRHLEKRQPPRSDLLGWMLVVLVAMLLAWYTLLAPDMAARIILMNGVAAFLTGRLAWNVTRQALSPHGWVGPHVLAALLWFVTFTLTVTSTITAYTGEPSQDLFNPSVPLATLWTVNPLMLLLIPLAILWVVRRGQRQEGSDYLHRTRTALKTAREAFMARSDEAAALALRQGEPMVFALVDLDDFKRTAAEYGYPTADVLLKWVEDQITGALRIEDELVRESVDRFAIRMPHLEMTKALMELDTLCHRIAAGTCTVDGTPVKTTVSIGVASLQPGRSTARELTSAAQLALYRARSEGRNRVAAAGDAAAGFDMSAFDKR